MSNTIEQNSKVEWKDVNWGKTEKAVFKLQKRIYRASARGDLKAVRRLQKTLMRSYHGRLLAVRRVSQDNQGKVTAGVDGIKRLTPKQRLEMADNLRLTGKASPTRRVYIPKPGSEEKRPLGIPTMADRARQALAKLALEPEWEARFHENSYGFRLGRSAQDATDAIFNNIRKKAKYILDADIAKCFDKINHEALLKKVNIFPTLRRQIKSWLKAGVMNEGTFENTESGTPQGGVISPLLANIALHGIEEDVEALSFRSQHRKEDGKLAVKKVNPTLIRYADDLVVICEEELMTKGVKGYIEGWLSKIGLELKPSKTRICHTSEGFNFLGFNIRQYEVGAYRAAKGGNQRKVINLGFKTLIKPSKEAIKRHLDKIGEIIKRHTSASQEELIKKLNPIIRGWCNYYDQAVSKEVFSKCDNQVYIKLQAWVKRKCPQTGAYERNSKYWREIDGNRWTFATKDGLALIRHADTKITRHVKVKGNKSPFDGDTVYWGQRLQSHPELTGRVQKLLKMQKGKCPECRMQFKSDDVMEVDHIKPRVLGGRDTYSNLQLLHRHCHDTKSAKDGSRKSKHQVQVIR